ncbi:MAG: OsmC family protein [Bacteroidia bacterium]|nr:OsmC family protein [Bacteroidia bacterium]
MKVKIERQNQAVHFEAGNIENIKVNIDGSPEAGGIGKGVRPMELVLMALGSCSSIDVVLILEKMRQELIDLKIEVEGKRAEDKVPKVFTDIHLKFILTGKLDESKVEKALDLAVNKYCSVKDMLHATVKITHSFEIISQ